MKSIIKAVAVAAVLAVPALSFAQSNQPVTRAQVRAELVQLEKAGYNPGVISDSKYPADVQAAELTGVAQPDRHAAGIDHPLDVHCGVTGDVAGEGQ